MPRLQVSGLEADLLLRRFLLEAGFYGSADTGQHLLRRVRISAGGLQLQVFLECLGCARRRDHFVTLEGSLADHVHALPIVRIRLVGIGSDNLVKGCNCVVDLAGIGEHGAGVEVILARPGGIGLSGESVSFYGIVYLIGFGIRFRKVVVIGSQAGGLPGGVFVQECPA